MSWVSGLVHISSYSLWNLLSGYPFSDWTLSGPRKAHGPTSQPGSSQKTPRCIRKRPGRRKQLHTKSHPGDPQATCDAVLIKCSSEPAGTRRGTRAIYPTASGRLYVYVDRMNSITVGTRRNPRGTRAIKRSRSAAVCTNRKIARC